MSESTYWDYAEAAWVPSPPPVADADLPPQRTGLEEVAEADVPSR